MKLHELFEGINFSPITQAIASDMHKLFKDEGLDIDVSVKDGGERILAHSHFHGGNIRIELFFYEDEREHYDKMSISQFSLGELKGKNLGSKIVAIIMKHLPKNVAIEGDDYTAFSKKTAENGKSFWEKMKEKYPNHKWALRVRGAFGMTKESSDARKFDAQLHRINKDPSAWGSESGFIDFAKKRGYEVETAPDFLYATRDKRYFGFYDRYAGDGLLLDHTKHAGFGSRDECLDALVDD